MSDEEPLMTVATFDSLTAAEIARAVLDAEGIRSFLADGEMVNTAWILSGALGGVKLKVAKSDFLAAERVLNSQRGKYGPDACDDYGLPFPRDAFTKDRPSKAGRRDAVTLDPAHHQTPPETDDPDELENAETTATLDSLFRKALIVAVVGVFICPVVAQAYSLQLLSQAQELGVPITGRQALLLRGLQVFNGVILAFAVALLSILWMTR
jgi:hypothetical protein